MFRFPPLLAAMVVIGFALFTFWRVRVDYAARGKLTFLSTVLQFVVFAVHGVARPLRVDRPYDGSHRRGSSPESLRP